MKNRLFILLIFILPVFTNSSCRDVATPPTPDESDTFDACITYPGSNQTLDIVTFNVETFPRNGYTSVIVVASLLNTIDADVYALQEVASKTSFESLVKLMPGYTGLFYPINNSDWNLAYIYKNSEISLYESATTLLFTDSQYFPRPAFQIKIHHNPTNTDTYIINNHLKCCGGSDNEYSRRSASEILKDYIDVSHPNDAVIVLGDLNDEITGTVSSENPFPLFY